MLLSSKTQANVLALHQRVVLAADLRHGVVPLLADLELRPDHQMVDALPLGSPQPVAVHLHGRAQALVEELPTAVPVELAVSLPGKEEAEAAQPMAVQPHTEVKRLTEVGLPTAAAPHMEE